MDFRGEDMQAAEAADRLAELRGLIRDLTTCLENRNAEIKQLRDALRPFARHAHCVDQIQPSSLALWCAQALNALAEKE